MHKVCSALLALLLLSFVPARAGDIRTMKDTNAVDILTGELWQKSSPEEKRSFLFGVDTAVTVERYVDHERREKAEKAGRNFRSHLSPFERGWMEGLKEIPRKDLIAKIDSWYEAHPEKLERPVMSVIWFEIIEPRLPKREAKTKR